jgi:PEGA domain
VTVDVEGAQLVVGGKPAGQAPLVDPVFVDPGKVVLSAFKDGHETAQVEVEVSAGQELPVGLSLKKVEAKGAPSVTAAPTATVPPPPPARSKVPALVMGGVGVASLIAGGVLVGVGASASSELHAGAPRGGDGRLLCWATPAPGSATLPECDEWRSSAANASTVGNVGIGFFVLGGLAAAGTAAYLLWPRRSSPPALTAWQLVPVAGPGGGGAVLRGEF